VTQEDHNVEHDSGGKKSKSRESFRGNDRENKLCNLKKGKEFILKGTHPMRFFLFSKVR